MKDCPVTGCGALILPDALVCREDWNHLPFWARDDLTMLRQNEPGSELHQRTIAVALAYLNDLAATREQVAG